MTLRSNVIRLALVSLMAVGLSGCYATGDRRTTNTLVGAGLGGATGAVLSGGDPLMTIGGAAAGGILGNVLTEDRGRDRNRNKNKNKNHHRRYHR